MPAKTLIKTERTLLIWLSEQAKSAEPKEQIIEGFVQAFDSLIFEFYETGVFTYWEDGGGYVSGMLETLHRYPTLQTCGVRVLGFIQAVFEEVGTGDLSRAQAIRILAQMLGLDREYLREKRSGDKNMVVSTQRFIKRYGVEVRAKIAPKPKKEFTDHSYYKL